TMLFDLNQLQAVQQLNVVDEFSTLGIDVHRRNRFATDTGFVSPFTSDGRYIFSEQNRYELQDGQLIKNEGVTVNGDYPNDQDPGWRFDQDGFAVFGAPFGDKLLYRIEDLDNVLLNVTDEEIPLGQHKESGNILAVGPFPDSAFVYDENGTFKFALESAGGRFSFPRSEGSHFLLFGFSGHGHPTAVPDELVIVRPPAGRS
ncbi:MAG: hypothetical protein AAF456_17335, partial [Planctomycetota bacterium]